MMLNEQKQRYAAWVLDPAQGVEFGLYPYPADRDGLTATLKALGEMPHTPEERAAVVARLLEKAAGFLSAEERAALATQWGPDETTETGEPLELTLDEQNYPLVYAAMQVALTECSAPFQREAAPAPPDATTLPAQGAEARDVTFSERARQILEHAACAKYEEGMTLARELKGEIAKVQEAVTALGTGLAGVVPAAADAAGETPEAGAAPAALVQAQEAAARYLAETVALYLQLLRKPQSRDKSVETLTSELAARGEATLSYMLEDLRLEYSAGPLPAAASAPPVVDPTAGAAEADTPSPDSEDALEVRAETSVSPAEEWASEEDGDPDVLTLFWGLKADEKVASWRQAGIAPAER